MSKSPRRSNRRRSAVYSYSGTNFDSLSAACGILNISMPKNANENTPLDDAFGDFQITYDCTTKSWEILDFRDLNKVLPTKRQFEKQGVKVTKLD